VRRDRPAGAARQPVEIIAGVGLESCPRKAGFTAAADYQARHARPPAAQQQHLWCTVGDREAEVGQEPVGPVEVRLPELQPRQASHLDQRVRRPPGMLAGQGPGLTVQRTVRILPRTPTGWQLGRRVSFHHNHSSLGILSRLISFVINYQL
jgi:hypothetical protein